MRPSHDEYFLQMLQLVAARSTCPRRAVGAIIVSGGNHILSTGYNGVPRGVYHCNETQSSEELSRSSNLIKPMVMCEGKHDQPGDTSRCLAVHAEQNAILQCLDLSRAYTLYCSAVPCFTCAKLIANTPIRRIVALEAYYGQSEDLLKAVGVEIIIHGATPIEPTPIKWSDFKAK